MTPEECALLDCLIYDPEFTNEWLEESTVGYILTQVDPNSPPAEMTAAEWRDVIGAAKSDPDICGLTVDHMSVDPASGARMACFLP
jgi:hypothetical protein